MEAKLSRGRGRPEKADKKDGYVGVRVPKQREKEIRDAIYGLLDGQDLAYKGKTDEVGSKVAYGVSEARNGQIKAPSDDSGGGYKSVAVLCSENPNLMEYVKKLEKKIKEYESMYG